MAEPVNNKTLGGLTYNANLVKSAKKLKNGQYELIFKSGEKFTYPEQKPLVARECGDTTDKAETGETLEGWPIEGKIYPRNAKIE